MLNGESRPSWKPIVRSYTSPSPPGGMNGRSAATTTSTITPAKISGPRSSDSPRPRANSGASASGAIFVAAPSPTKAPRTGAEVIASRAKITRAATSASLEFVASAKVV
jgi:hypothetical protein